jgi:hypothetical protein
MELERRMAFRPTVFCNPEGRGVRSLISSRNVALILITGLLISAAALVTLTRTPQTTSSVTITATKEVSEAYDTYLHNFESKNATALAGQYTDNGTLVLYGNNINPLVGPENLGGTFQNSTNIRILYGVMFEPDNFETINLTTNGAIILAVEHGFAVNSTIRIKGNEAYSVNSTSNATGEYVATASLTITYVHANDNWLIAKEYWDWTGFHICGPTSTNFVPRC